MLLKELFNETGVAFVGAVIVMTLLFTLLG